MLTMYGVPPQSISTTPKTNVTMISVGGIFMIATPD